MALLTKSTPVTGMCLTVPLKVQCDVSTGPRGKLYPPTIQTSVSEQETQDSPSGRRRKGFNACLNAGLGGVRVLLRIWFTLRMWARKQRGRMARIARETKRYPSDRTDEEWERIAPLMPNPGRRIRRRRAAVDSQSDDRRHRLQPQLMNRATHPRATRINFEFLFKSIPDIQVSSSVRNL